jgi:ABC-type uncharacterized transport system auxiliary subunit
VTRRLPLLLLALLSLPGTGCALLSKDQPTLLRYYSLDPTPHPPQRVPGAASASAPSTSRLRVGKVTAALYIRDRMAFRESGFEVGYYEDFRWTERPESYVRRDLARALFDDEGVEESVGGAGLTLDVDIDSFEEVRDKHAAIVQLSWQLRDDTVVLQRRTVTVERPLGQDVKDGSSHMALAIALSSALDDAIHRLVGQVLPRLSEPAGTSSANGGRLVRVAE